MNGDTFDHSPKRHPHLESPSHGKALAKYKSLNPAAFRGAQAGRLFSPKASFSSKMTKHASQVLSQSTAKLPDLVPKNERAESMSQQMIYSTMDCKGEGPRVPRIEMAKASTKRIGVVRAYAANTHQGVIRNYNEDRVAIILNIVKPAGKKAGLWPKCALFGIYDGHGGSACADFLRDTLHHTIIRESTFPADTTLALTQGFAEAERQFVGACEGEGPGSLRGDRSGSCAVVAMLVNDVCYIGNVGDSRAVMSSSEGTVVSSLSTDHKPADPMEFTRIINNGGNIYQAQISDAVKSLPGNEGLEAPLRVLPGRLSVSRTFGDVEAKLHKYKGKPGVVVAIPDVKTVKIDEGTADFILLGCDGIFDKLSSNQVVQIVWEKARSLSNRGKTVHEITGECVSAVLQEAMERGSLDNVTVVMIAFSGFKRALAADKIVKEHQLDEAIQKQLTYYSSQIRKMGAHAAGKKVTQPTHPENVAGRMEKGSFVARREGGAVRIYSPVGVLHQSLSPPNAGLTQTVAIKSSAIIKKSITLKEERRKDPASLNFAGIKGLIELSKKGKAGN